MAEGVETKDQLAFLRGLGCDEMQGYLLSRPLPAAQLVAWLQRPRGDGNSLRSSLDADARPQRPARDRTPALAGTAAD